MSESSRPSTASNDHGKSAQQDSFVGSPLATLDPSRITNMLVDQTGLGNSANDDFVFPTHHQHGPRSVSSEQQHHTQAMQRPNSRINMEHGHSSQAGTPNQQPQQMHNPNQMHMQQQGSVCSPAMSQHQPMTPQHMMQPPHTPGGGQYPGSVGAQDYQQQQQYQSPGHPGPGMQGQQQPPHMPQQQQGNDSSPGMYNRQVMQQQQQGMMPQQMVQQHPQQQQQPGGMPPGMMGGPPPGQGGPQFPGYPQNAQQQQQWVHAQQQQQMQQAHYARQPQMMGQGQSGQRVMIQRVVPYPPGYGGMQPQVSGGVPIPNGQPGGPGPFPGRPQVAGGQLQRPAYPGGKPQPQQYGAGPGPAGYPPGQAAAAAAYQQQAAAYQQQMYQRQQVVGPPMRPYISPQQQQQQQAVPGAGQGGGMVTPVSHQGVYGNNPQQPQTPQTPQPFTPNGGRFPQPTPSPHYGGGPADMRSPPLMSPNQQGMPPQQAMPRPMSNGDLAPMRMAVPQQQSVFFAHDPQVAGSVSPDMCLTGCVLHLFDIERFNTDKMDLSNLALAVKLHGGEVDFGPKTFTEKLPIITHVVVDCHRGTIPLTALKERKRLVTLQWLCDTLRKKQMEVPSKLAHLPCGWSNEFRPLVGKTISLSGFDESERSAIQWMIECCGARMTPSLSRHNNLLIAKVLGVEKVLKAQEWDVPVVNYQYLADNYVGMQRPDVDNPRYQVGQPCDVTPGPYAMEMMMDSFKQLLAAWKFPIMIQPDQWSRSMETRRVLESDDSVFPNKRHRLQQQPGPSDEDLAKVEKEREQRGEKPTVLVAFCGIEDDVKDMLSRKLRYLGGAEVDSVSECSHLVATQGGRTERFLEAIALGKNIVQPYWIIHGYECRQFMDTLDYFLRDEDMEKNLGYSCRRSVLRARSRPIFQDITFHITPSVVPSMAVLSRLIQLAGGKVEEEQPSPAKIAHCIETESSYVVVSCEADIKSLQYLLDCNFPVYSTEFVLMSLLRQELEPHPGYRVAATPQARLPPHMMRAPPIRPPMHEAPPQRVRA